MRERARLWGDRGWMSLQVSIGLLATVLASGARPHAALAQTGLTPSGVDIQSGPQDQVLKKAGMDQKLHEQVPLDIPFRDETGKAVSLGQYFGRKPVMLILIQYRCRMLCSQEMAVLAQSLKAMKFSVGDQFTALTVSIDARETPALAAAYKKGYVEKYGRPGAAAGWHFLTGNAAAIRRLADAIGYRFTYDPQTDQFAHPDGVIILTPTGKIARYFLRLQYPPDGLRLALVEAAAGKIGTPLDALALLCFHYNPVTGRYGLLFTDLVRWAGIATLLALAGGVILMNRRGRGEPVPEASPVRPEK